MKIYCDYCGTQIETSIHKNCPNCGGAYSTDEELLKEKARVKELNDLDMEKKKLDIERMKLENSSLKTTSQKQGNNFAKGCLVAVISGLACLGIVFVIILCFVFADTSSETNKEKPEETRPRITATYTLSMDPISIPDIPEINVPDVTIPEIDIPDINTNLIEQ